MAACTPSLAVESRGSWNSGKQTPMGGVATSAAGVVSSMRGVVSGNSGPFRAISGGAAGLPSALFHSNKPSRTLITSRVGDRPTWRLRPARCRAPAGGRRPRFGRLATVGVLVEHLELLVWSPARQALDLGEEVEHQGGVPGGALQVVMRCRCSRHRRNGPAGSFPVPLHVSRMDCREPEAGAWRSWFSSPHFLLSG